MVLPVPVPFFFDCLDFLFNFAIYLHDSHRFMPKNWLLCFPQLIVPSFLWLFSKDMVDRNFFKVFKEAFILVTVTVGDCFTWHANESLDEKEGKEEVWLEITELSWE